MNTLETLDHALALVERLNSDPFNYGLLLELKLTLEALEAQVKQVVPTRGKGLIVVTTDNRFE